MEKPNSKVSEAFRRLRPSGPNFALLFSIVLLAVGGCGAPGEPTPPSPPIPTAITDLSARQDGDGVQLTFTLPSKTVSGDRLEQPPAVEVHRGSLKPDGSPDAKSFRVVQTIPGVMVEHYRSEEHIQVVDPVPPEQGRAHPNGLAYRVRTRASRRRASGESNTVMIHMLPVAERIPSLQSHVTETVIELSWPAPTRTSAGDPLGPIVEYHVYRGEIDPASAEAAAKNLTQAEWKSPLSLLGRSPTGNYGDGSFEFEKTYVYTVRTVISQGGASIESGDSAPAVVAPHDIFPPAVPQGLVAALIGESPGHAPEVDLSWSINTEPDLAGYRLYRSEQQSTPGELVTPDLLLSPAYRDTSVQPGHHYWYSVTAVDRSGNESAHSEIVGADVMQPSS
jgi:hypothetical protein